MKNVNKKSSNNNEKKKELGLFIKNNILKKTNVLSIIGIVLFIFILCVFSMSELDLNYELDKVEKISFIETIKERIIILLLILLAGWVPYFYIPAIAFGAYVLMLAGDVALAMETKSVILTILFNILPVVIDVITVGVITAIGIYMCTCTTRKYRYTQRSSFSLLDVKIHLYQIAKKQDKYEEAIAKKQQRIEKLEQNNVKIDYTSILKIAPVVILVNILVCAIEYLINN